MINDEKLDSICDKVRFAISVGDELDNEMKSHLDECEECRTFLEHSKIMMSELEKLGFDTFTKDGKTVADSVMEEVERQKIFTSGKKLQKNNGLFRHMGLIAACAVIVIMALPVMNGILGVDKDSAAVEYEGIAENNFVAYSGNSASGSDAKAAPSVCDDEGEETYIETAEAEVVESENYAAVTDGIMFMARPHSAENDKSAVESKVAVTEELQTHDVVDYSTDMDDYDFYEGFAAPANGGAFKKSEMITDSSEKAAQEADDEDLVVEELYDVSDNDRYSLYEDGYEDDTGVLFENIEDAAFRGAVMYCDSEDVVDKDSLVISYTDADTAYAVFTIENNGDITVYLKKENGMWAVIDVCDGDITE